MGYSSGRGRGSSCNFYSIDYSRGLPLVESGLVDAINVVGLKKVDQAKVSKIITAHIFLTMRDI